MKLLQGRIKPFFKELILRKEKSQLKIRYSSTVKTLRHGLGENNIFRSGRKKIPIALPIKSITFT